MTLPSAAAEGRPAWDAATDTLSDRFWWCKRQKKLTSELGGNIIVASSLGPAAYTSASSVDLNVSNNTCILLWCTVELAGCRSH